MCVYIYIYIYAYILYGHGFLPNFCFEGSFCEQPLPVWVTVHVAGCCEQELELETREDDGAVDFCDVQLITTAGLQGAHGRIIILVNFVGHLYQRNGLMHVKNMKNKSDCGHQ